MVRTGLGLALASLSLLPLAARADAIPACAGAVEISGTMVSRIEQNGVLITNDGIAIKLEGIRLPSARADRAPGFPTDQAYGSLRDLTRSRSVTLTAVEPKQDRYDRVRAQVFAASTDNQLWIQKRLLEQGLARVALAPDRVDCAGELYAAEGVARAARKGIWNVPAYAIRTPETVHSDIGTFQIVEGRVLDVNISGDRAYLNFGSDWRSDFTAVIQQADMDRFDVLGVNPHGYAGKVVRVRGLVQQLNGPSIDVVNPQSIEVIN